MTYVGASHDKSTWRAHLADRLKFLLGKDGESAKHN